MPAYDVFEDRCPTRLVLDRLADKWALLVLDRLRGEPVRFNGLRRDIKGVSQKVLSQTLKALERDGLVTRKIYPVVPPKVEYSLTELGLTLSAAFCGVWVWAAEHLEAVAAAREMFDRSKDEN